MGELRSFLPGETEHGRAQVLSSHMQMIPQLQVASRTKHLFRHAFGKRDGMGAA